MSGADVTPGSTPGRALWLDASRLGLANGASVVSVPDLSGNGFDLTQPTAGSRGTFAAAGRNGLGVLQLDGADDFYANASNVWPVDDVTILAVLAPGASGEYFSQNTPMGGNLRYHFYNPGGAFRRWDAGPTKAVAADAWCLVTYWAAGVNETLCVNGAGAVVGSARPASSNRQFVLGSLSAAGPVLPQALKLGELLVLSRVAPEWERLALEAHLRRKWATP